MEAGEVIGLSANCGDLGTLRFQARVLFWWEVQSARESSVVAADIVNKRFFDRSKFMRTMVDLFVDSVEQDGRSVSGAEIGGRRWTQCLHPASVKPTYDAYTSVCHPSSEELLDFRQKVATYFGGPDENSDSGIFVAPVEVMEVAILSRCGGLTLSEIRKLSYDKFRKYMIVLDQVGQFGPVGPPISAPQVGGMMDGAAGALGVPLSVLSNPNLSPQQAKMQSESEMYTLSRQGGFGGQPE